MPSPTMATVPYFWSFLTTSALSPGSTSDTTFSTPICFATATDNTGGNSGSPVFNSKGELIGTGFDRNYEGLTGDIAYNPQLQRAACVDIRYTLFIIDKFAGAKHLIDEMTIVE